MKSWMLRAVAILIAVAGVLDPAVTMVRRTKPVLSLVATDPVAYADLAGRIRRDLRGRFTLVEAPFAGADATVIVGDRLPAHAAELPSPLFAVLPEPDGPSVAIEAVHAPSRALLESRVPVAVTARVSGGTGQRLTVTLRMGGVVVDRVEHTLGPDARQVVSLALIPPAPGVLVLRVDAEISGATRGAAADLVVDVRERTRPILFYDPRPSWMSTFVRRAVERDPRFVVTSRIVTSRDVSTDAGRPPARLDALASLASFDVVVVGAPEALTAADVNGLDAFLRRRGGSVVLLLDRAVSGPYERLTAAGKWELDSSLVSVFQGSDTLRAAHIAWPARLPPGATSMASDARDRPVVWRSPVGAGTLVVSGALDAWRFRDPAASGFEAFWRDVIGTAADAAAEPVRVHIEEPVLRPGEAGEITVTARDAALADLASGRPLLATASAAVETPEGRTFFRLWPDGAPGRWKGAFRGPSLPGTYQFSVTVDGNRVEAPFVVADAVSRSSPDERELVSAFAASRGGSAVVASRSGDLPDEILSVIRPAWGRVSWHPMRSGWWILPFAVLLGLEWLLRRRGGMA